MTDLANLQIRIQSLEASVADKRLASLAKSGAKAERATDGLVGSVKALVGPLLATAGATAALSKITNVTRQFDILNAQLITATGNSENAATAFEAIQDFAAQTPYDLQQATTGFTKLVNLGLDPSERALRSYGDTASAMGKDLNDMIEAVADAATGEFERLKEFGIKAKSEGDNVSFTFRGVTTTVKKNAEEIEGYLLNLGETNFGGAMLQRMDSLDGAMSNLGDEWDKLFLNISNAGVGDFIEGEVRTAIASLEELNTMFDSGQMEGYINAIISKFDGLGEDIAATLDVIGSMWNEFIGTDGGSGIVGATDSAVDLIIGAFRNMPENLRAIIKLVAVEFAALVDYAAEYGAAFGRVLGSEFAKVVEKAKAYGQAIGEAINPFDDVDMDTSHKVLEQRLKDLDSLANEMADEEFKRAEKAVQISREARRSSIEDIMAERDAAIKSFDDQIKAATNLRAEYDKQKANEGPKGDRLAQFNLGASATGQAQDEGPSKEEIKAQEAREKAFEKLRLSLRTEEEEIQESYTRRLAIILENTEEGSVQQQELKKRLDEQFATDALGDLATPDTYEEQLSQINDFYEARRALILDNVALTEEERTALEEELTAQRNERLQALEKERVSVILNSGAQIFDELAGLAKEFAGEQSSLYKGMFAISKAFSIADSIVKIQQGIANAAALPFPSNLGAIGSVVSATAGVISTISGTQFSGAHDAGGVIPQGKVGLVGEFGPELVAGPANVRSRRETAEMFKEGSQSTPQPQSRANPTVVKIINLVDPSLVDSYMQTSEGEEAVLNIISSNPEHIQSVASA